MLKTAQCARGSHLRLTVLPFWLSPILKACILGSLKTQNCERGCESLLSIMCAVIAWKTLRVRCLSSKVNLDRNANDEELGDIKWIEWCFAEKPFESSCAKYPIKQILISEITFFMEKKCHPKSPFQNFRFGIPIEFLFQPNLFCED